VSRSMDIWTTADKGWFQVTEWSFNGNHGVWPRADVLACASPGAGILEKDVEWL
jgi:hypothetical protein